ncbi:CPBP family intramembrane glutamic endopeptidase [Terribacillus saccharophilus]|uniref:CPBP family intramembrane glutamic endopeptidase n=1 Tax=Terribacillus saccharophilus TaxID=361277 RepID=UPI000BA6A10D|nr:type II CAAX endopeptidase family protein [Terribacillus saccharophilus]PAF16298.1 CPBP family intramembrane metalloprotease [Terribacillus saccharophilus]
MPARYWFVILTYIVMQLSAFLLVPFVPWMDDRGLDLATVSYWWSLITFLLAVVIVCFMLRKDMRAPAVRNATGSGMTIVWIIIGFFGAYAGQVIAGLIETYAFGITQGSENTSSILDAVREVPAFVLIVVVFAPILEEIIFRKILFGEIYKRTNFFVAVLISALVFGAVHGDFLHLLQYFVMGVVFAALYVQTKRIIVPIITHGLMNLMVVIIQLYITPERMEEIERMQKQLENMQMIIFGG